jgi:hypothetical protein
MTHPPPQQSEGDALNQDPADFQQWALDVIKQALAHLAATRAARTQAKAGLANRAVERRRRLIRAVAYVVGLSTVAAVVVMIVSNLSSANDFIPANLVGVWTTTAPRYESTVLELRGDSIIFHGEFGANGFGVSEVSSQRDERGLRYDVDYMNIDAVHTFSFYHHQAPPSIQIRNLEEVEWRFGGKSMSSLRDGKAMSAQR